MNSLAHELPTATKPSLQPTTSVAYVVPGLVSNVWVRARCAEVLPDVEAAGDASGLGLSVGLAPGDASIGELGVDSIGDAEGGAVAVTAQPARTVTTARSGGCMRRMPEAYAPEQREDCGVPASP